MVPSFADEVLKTFLFERALWKLYAKMWAAMLLLVAGLRIGIDFWPEYYYAPMLAAAALVIGAVAYGRRRWPPPNLLPVGDEAFTRRGLARLIGYSLFTLIFVGTLCAGPAFMLLVGMTLTDFPFDAMEAIVAGTAFGLLFGLSMAVDTMRKGIRSRTLRHVVGALFWVAFLAGIFFLPPMLGE